MQSLRNRLDEAIRSEDYEEAASLRDEIRKLQDPADDRGKDMTE